MSQNESFTIGDKIYTLSRSNPNFARDTVITPVFYTAKVWANGKTDERVCYVPVRRLMNMVRLPRVGKFSKLNMGIGLALYMPQAVQHAA